jgi:hypothetical protein
MSNLLNIVFDKFNDRINSRYRIFFSFWMLKRVSTVFAFIVIIPCSVNAADVSVFENRFKVLDSTLDNRDISHNESIGHFVEQSYLFQNEVFFKPQKGIVMSKFPLLSFGDVVTDTPPENKVSSSDYCSKVCNSYTYWVSCFFYKFSSGHFYLFPFFSPPDNLGFLEVPRLRVVSLPIG